jgi:large subunit ribosomal protein L18
MKRLEKKLQNRLLRKQRVRSSIFGSSSRPRLSVNISNMHISAQLIDDSSSSTLASMTTVGSKQAGTMTDRASWIGRELAKKAKKAKINQVVFDRNGHRYAGRLRALADSARAEGLEF